MQPKKNGTPAVQRLASTPFFLIMLSTTNHATFSSLYLRQATLDFTGLAGFKATSSPT